MADYVRVCTATDVPDEGSLRVTIAGEPVVLVHTEGEIFALRDVCSHAEVALSDGEVQSGRIECWLHGSQFDVRSGHPCQRPATQPVPVYPVKIDGDDVLVALEDYR